MPWSAETQERYRETMARINSGEGFIYAARVGRKRKIKIGFSLKPESRLRTLAVCTKRSGTQAILIKAVPGSIRRERELHRELAAHSLSGGLGNEFYPRSILDHPAVIAIFGRQRSGGQA
jgi:hypothetical protein